MLCWDVLSWVLWPLLKICLNFSPRAGWSCILAQFCDERDKGDWDRTQINSSTYLVASVGRRPRRTIDLVPEVQTKAGGVAGISAPYCIHSPSDNCPAYCQSLLNAAGKETALKNRQADFPLLLQSPFCCEKGSGAVCLETNGSLSGRRVLSFFPHTVHITFFFSACCCSTSEWNQK